MAITISSSFVMAELMCSLLNLSRCGVTEKSGGFQRCQIDLISGFESPWPTDVEKQKRAADFDFEQAKTDEWVKRSVHSTSAFNKALEKNYMNLL